MTSPKSLRVVSCSGDRYCECHVCLPFPGMLNKPGKGNHGIFNQMPSPPSLHVVSCSGDRYCECHVCLPFPGMLKNHSHNNCVCLTKTGQCISTDDRCPCICSLGEGYRWCRPRKVPHNCPSDRKFERFCLNHYQFNGNVALESSEEVN